VLVRLDGEIVLTFVVFSWQDGNPEYLSDLDRQVMQKQRLRQVKIRKFYVTFNHNRHNFAAF
jgi:hypothetical protein